MRINSCCSYVTVVVVIVPVRKLIRRIKKELFPPQDLYSDIKLD